MQTTETDAGLELSFAGLLTFHDGGAAEAAIDAVRAYSGGRDGPQVAINLERVEALDSHWVGAFVRLLRLVRVRDGGLVLLRPRPEVRRLLEVVELDRIIEIRA